MTLTLSSPRTGLVAAAAASVAVMLAVAVPAAAANSSGNQQGRSDSDTACALQPDPLHPGRFLYPAVDDLVFTAANFTTDVAVLNNDCVNTNPGTRWAFTYTQPETQEDVASGATGRDLHPAGTVDVEPGGGSLRYIPPPDFLGVAEFTYSWVESGTESGVSYTGRRSTTATVTIRVFPSSAPPTPPTASPTSSGPVDTSTPTPTASSASSAPVSSGTPIASPSTVSAVPAGGISQPPRPITPTADPATPELPVTGARPTLALLAGLAAVLIGAVLLLVGRRRREVSPR